MASIAESLKRAEQILRSCGIAEPKREAISLLMLATKRDKTFVYAHDEYILTEDEARTFDWFLQRRADREPLQYIAGVQEFYGLNFEVTPDVLIPRPETEMVVERAIKILGAMVAPRFCEVGVGSGCIAVSILHAAGNARAIGLDVSAAALAVAGRNAEKHGVLDRLRLVESDVFDELPYEKFELIVSNPPYIPLRDFEDLQAEVRDFEPRGALTDGDDGLTIISRIVDEAPAYLLPRGFLLIEIGFDQSERVASMLDPGRWRSAELLPDLQGIPRLVCAQIK